MERKEVAVRPEGVIKTFQPKPWGTQQPKIPATTDQAPPPPPPAKND